MRSLSLSAVAELLVCTKCFFLVMCTFSHCIEYWLFGYLANIFISAILLKFELGVNANQCRCPIYG